MEVSRLTASICGTSVAVTLACGVLIMQPLCSRRLRSHEHRAALLPLVLLFVGIGMIPFMYSAAELAVFLRPHLANVIDPGLKCCEALALLLFWHILVALAGGSERAALCVETSTSGASCAICPCFTKRFAYNFGDGRSALRFWCAAICQWIVVSPVVKLMAQSAHPSTRLSAIPIQVVGLLIMLRALFDTHRATRHAAPRHARPDAQFIIIKMFVLLLLVQTTVYQLHWPPPKQPEEVTRMFAFMTAVEMGFFGMIFARGFGALLTRELPTLE